MPRGYLRTSPLLGHDSCDQTSSDSPATLTNVEALTSLSSNRVVGLQDHLDVVTRHNSARLVAVREAEVSSLV